MFTQDAKKTMEIKDEVNAVKGIGGKAEFVQNIEPKLENIQRRDRIPRASTI